MKRISYKYLVMAVCIVWGNAVTADDLYQTSAAADRAFEKLISKDVTKATSGDPVASNKKSSSNQATNKK